MKQEAKTPGEYIAQVPVARREAFYRLRQVIRENLPEGFRETMSYGMIGYVVPHEIYPNGYHVNPKLPLPFIHLGSQKNHIAVYHYGLYADPQLQQWFTSAYPQHTDAKPDMGKSCIRFKSNPRTESVGKIPFPLFGELAGKMTIQDWISLYEQSTKR